MALFNFGKKKEEEKKTPACACSCGCAASEAESITNDCCPDLKEGEICCIKVLGSGCCHALQFAPHGGHWCVCQRPPGGAQRPPSLRYFDRLNNNNVMLRCPLHNSVG